LARAQRCAGAHACARRAAELAELETNFPLAWRGAAAVVLILLIPSAFFTIVGLRLGPAAVMLPLVGALKASRGEYYTYPIVGTAPQ
jgi:uncharacterized membrane protein